MYPHRIHLRGPWEYEPLQRIERPDPSSPDLSLPLPPPGTMRLPCRWSVGGLSGFCGVVRFRRRFGRPARLDPHERLWLVCEGADAVSQWHLNGHDLGSHVGPFTPLEFDITDRLESRNELTVEVARHDRLPVPVPRGKLGPDGGLWGSVALEVRGPADLTDLTVRTSWTADHASVHAEGLIRTTRAAILELHLLLDETLIHRQTFGTLSAPQPVRLDCSLNPAELRTWPTDPQPYRLCLELIEGGTCWYTATLPVGFRDTSALCGRAETMDLTEPIREARRLSEADRHGQPVRLRLPETDRWSEEVRNSYRQIVWGLAHHPSIVAWIVGGRDAEQIAAELRAGDPTRPVLVE
ncbi:MAG: hypothetical protein NZM31_13205 [Gemmatales bacterium]|nr:hypothetical protein [Gemmatales bacterium]MDW8387955.1 hypothetical protein [Gemmatales bacterium]